MTTHSEEHTISTSIARRAALASFVGTTIEWFDYFIYGTAAALVFGTLFFPELDAHTGRLASFATFGVAFVARPVGAAIFGHLGDRLGRRATLITTLSIMGVATGLIGCLPTYSQIGIWAPILLMSLRLLQGAAVGGEWGGAVLLSVEHAPPSKRRLYGSAPQLGSPLGLVLATAVMSFVATLPKDQLLSWGWRVPFLAGFVLVIIGLLIRLGVEEPLQFTKLKVAGNTARLPVKDLWLDAKAGLFTGIGLQASVNVVFYVIAVFFISYANVTLGMERSTALRVVTFAAVVDIPALAFFAHLSDRIGPYKVFVSGAVLSAVFIFPFFWLLNSGSLFLVVVTITGMMIFAHATMYAVISSLIADLFETRVRYSGTALSNALGGLIFSAPTPFIAEAITGGPGTHWWPLALMMIGASAISLIAIWHIRSQDLPSPVRVNNGISETTSKSRQGSLT